MEGFKCKLLNPLPLVVWMQNLGRNLGITLCNLASLCVMQTLLASRPPFEKFLCSEASVGKEAGANSSGRDSFGDVF